MIVTTSPVKDASSIEKSIVLWLIAIALFMETLDVTIICTAIPDISADLGVNPVSLKLALTSYLVSLAILIPISGWLADNYGTRNIFTIGLSLFTFGSILCGISSSLAMLIFARIVQGCGGALMMPVARIILLKTYSRVEIVKVTNYSTIPSLIGPALGPLLGGIISTYHSWRWIFFINIPFGLVGIICSLKYVRNHLYTVNKIDIFGLLLFGLGLIFVSIALQLIGENILGLISIATIFMTGLTLLVVYYYYSSQKLNNIVDFSLLKIPTFRITIFGSLLSRVGIGGIPFLLPLMLQLSFGNTPLVSGILVAPMAIGMIVMKFLVSKILRKLGFRKTMIINSSIVGITILLFSAINSRSSFTLIAVLVFLHGFFTSLHFSYLNVLAYSDIEEKKVSSATSFAATIQQFSMNIGVCASSMLIYFFNFRIGEELGNTVFHAVFISLSVFCFLTSIKFMELTNNDGNSLCG